MFNKPWKFGFLPVGKLKNPWEDIHPSFFPLTVPVEYRGTPKISPSFSFCIGLPLLKLYRKNSGTKNFTYLKKPNRSPIAHRRWKTSSLRLGESPGAGAWCIRNGFFEHQKSSEYVMNTYIYIYNSYINIEK